MNKSEFIVLLQSVLAEQNPIIERDSFAEFVRMIPDLSIATKHELEWLMYRGTTIARLTWKKLADDTWRFIDEDMGPECLEMPMRKTARARAFKGLRELIAELSGSP